MTVNVSDLIARLKEAEQQLPDPRTAQSDVQRAAWWTTRREHAQVISGLMNAPSDLAAVQTRLDDQEKRRRELIEKFAEVEGQIADFIDWRTIPDARQRDAEWDRQHNLRRMLQRLHEGSLLKAPDQTYERLEDIDARIKELIEKRDGLQMTLDTLVKQAEALLAAAITT